MENIDIMMDSPLFDKKEPYGPGRKLSGIPFGNFGIESDLYSPRQRLIIDAEGDFLHHVAPTMRNPNITKLNILDTIAEGRFMSRK